MRNEVNLKTWIIGVVDTAHISSDLSELINDTKKVILIRNKYYLYKNASKIDKFLNHNNFRRFSPLIAPVYLGYLAVRYQKFFYVGDLGFLENTVDGRFNEFRFLKKCGAIIVCYFTGNDIRSPKKTLKESSKFAIDLTINFHQWITPIFFTNKYEFLKKKTAIAADRFADKVFNHELDQISYLRRKQVPIIYFLPDNNFNKNQNKFNEKRLMRIVHSPSSPVIKGTQVIRTVIRQLRSKGYKFEYIELIDVPNSKVIYELSKSHIVINELYARAPGIFTLEALATYNCVLTSADPRADPSVHRSDYVPWVTVQPEDLFEQLSRLLSNSDQIQFYAEQGYEWAKKYASLSYAKKRFSEEMSGY
jgi:hypothetical protein